MSVRVTLLGRYNGTISTSPSAVVEDTGKSWEVPIPGEIKITQSSHIPEGQVWVYKSMPVLLPSQSRFEVKLEFGHQRPEVGDWVKMQGLEGFSEDGRIGQVSFWMESKADHLDKAVIRFSDGHTLAVEEKYMARASDLEVLADWGRK